jgi:hypothetical protein
MGGRRTGRRNYSYEEEEEDVLAKSDYGGVRAICRQMRLKLHGQATNS